MKEKSPIPIPEILLICFLFIQAKQKSLLSQEVRVMKLLEQGLELQRTHKLPAAAADRLTQLNDQWTSTNQRLSAYH